MSSEAIDIGFMKGPAITSTIVTQSINNITLGFNESPKIHI
jgi:hypothetical protein